MKNRILLLAFILFSTLIFGQNPVQQYYYYINKAELAICDSKLEKASKYYRKAFALHRPFSQDLRRSFNLHYYLLGDTAEALKCAHRLTQTDYSIYIDSIEHTSMYCHIKTMDDTVKRTIISALRDSLKTLNDDDQHNRKSGKGEDMELYHENILRLKKLYDQYGSINELNAGAYFERNYIHILLLHYWQFHELFAGDIVWSSVLNGDFDARSFANLASNCVRDMQMSYGYDNHVIVNETLFIYDPESVKKINENKQEINLSETWDDYVKKMIFSFNRKRPHFNFMVFKRLMTDDDELEVATRMAEIDAGEVKGNYYKRITK